jgi:hypothetical protein
LLVLQVFIGGNGKGEAGEEKKNRPRPCNAVSIS